MKLNKNVSLSTKKLNYNIILFKPILMQYESTKKKFKYNE